MGRCACGEVCMWGGVHVRRYACEEQGVHVRRCACVGVCMYGCVHVWRCGEVCM